MMPSLTIEAVGLADLDGLKELGPNMDKYAAIAVNHAARKTRTQASKEIRAEIAFKSSYLDSSDNGALRVIRFATVNNLEADIRGRFRATSLMQFVTGAKTPGRKNPTVRVATDGPELALKPAFVMKLRRGNAALSDAFNLGLALRVAPGESIRHKREMVQIGKGLYLLYGPSVDQAFRGMLPDLQPLAVDLMDDELARLVRRKVKT